MELATAVFGLAACALVLVAEHRRHEKEEAAEALADARVAALLLRHEAATWRPAHVERRVHVLFEPDRGSRHLERVTIVCAQDEPGLENDRLWVQLVGTQGDGTFMAVWQLGRGPDGEWVRAVALEGAPAEAMLAALADDAGGAVGKAG